MIDLIYFFTLVCLTDFAIIMTTLIVIVFKILFFNKSSRQWK